jgi:hypothetical protein
MKIWIVIAATLVVATLTPVTAGAQMPSVGSLPGANMLDKTALLDQAKKLVADLTAMKQDPKLPTADKSKVDTLLPKAQAVNTELAKPQVESTRLPQLASQLGDLQKQFAALKGVGR